MDLALQITGESYKTTAARIRGERLDKMEPIKQADDTEKNQAVIDKIKPHLKKLNGSDPASLYLKKRGLTVTPGQHVWYSAQRPSMVALFTNLAGELSTLHITYLTESGDKADIDVQKRFLPVVRTLIGSSIKLFNPENGVLAITEGIETALAVHQLEGLPVWAAGNATLLEAIQIPADVNEVWIYGDNDANFVGQKAAYNLANRLSREGKKVFVEIPNKFGEDFLDVLSRKQSETTARK
jgi:putative DNA primase/helicase